MVAAAGCGACWDGMDESIVFCRSFRVSRKLHEYEYK
jgi:hypothetical protein